MVGEFGFGKVVGVAECMMLKDTNMTEVAFSISPEFQGRGMGKIFLKKLAATSRENGMRGLIAYTIPSNTGMIRLFKSLPYKVKTHYEDGDLVLSCLFDELA